MKTHQSRERESESNEKEFLPQLESQHKQDTQRGLSGGSAHSPVAVLESAKDTGERETEGKHKSGSCPEGDDKTSEETDAGAHTRRH